MKKLFFLVLILMSLLLNNLPISAQEFTVSGLLDSSVAMSAGARDAPDFSLGLEEYANIRFQSKIRDKAVVYGAVNLIAATGNYAANAAGLVGTPVGQIIKYIDSNGEEKEAYIINGYNQEQGFVPVGINPSAFIAGENYIAGIELERLYFRLQGENIDFEGGLMRLPFGYGQVFGSSDFLNPRNPLNPDAHPRAILGAAFFWYPTEETKLNIFYSAPRDPLSQKGGGSFLGLSFDKHWNKASIQTLYSFETPKINSANGIHRVGLSAKADLEVGFVIDALYTYNYEAGTKWDGLSFSGGADYSFFSGKLIVLAEYLYNGDTSSTAAGYGGNFTNNHYLYTSLTLRFNDYTNMTAAVIIGFDDTSYIPIISLNHDLFQGAALIVSAQMPVERYFIVSTKLRLKF